MICKKCGNEYDDKYLFCSKCGLAANAPYNSNNNSNSNSNSNSDSGGKRKYFIGMNTAIIGAFLLIMSVFTPFKATGKVRVTLLDGSGTDGIIFLVLAALIITFIVLKFFIPSIAVSAVALIFMIIEVYGASEDFQSFSLFGEEFYTLPGTGFYCLILGCFVAFIGSVIALCCKIKSK